MDEAIREDMIETPRGCLFAKRWRGSGARDGAPIVLFHDSLGSVALWRDFPSELAQAAGRDVIAYDRLGFGQSDPSPGPVGNAFVHEEAHTGLPFILDHHEVQDFIAFGHSVGGGMAAGAAGAFPDRCLALITEAAQAFAEKRTLAGIRAAQASFADPLQLERLRRYHGAKTEWVLDAWIGTWLSPPFARWQLKEGLPPISCPLLAIHGTEDEFGSLAHPERLVTLTRGRADTAILQGGGHVPHRENPAFVLDAVTAFLAENLPREPRP